MKLPLNLYSESSARNVIAEFCGESGGMKIYAIPAKQQIIAEIEQNGFIFHCYCGSWFDNGYFNDKKEKIQNTLDRLNQPKIDVKQNMIEHVQVLWHEMKRTKRAEFERVVNRSVAKNICGATDEEFDAVIAACKETATNERLARIESERKQKELEEQKELAEKKNRLESNILKVRDGKGISGENLVELCDHFKITVPIRTRSFIQNKIARIDGKRVSLSEGNKLPDSVGGVWKAVESEVKKIIEN